LTENTTISGPVNYDGTDTILKFDSVPPSLLTITNTGFISGGGNGGITVKVQDDGTSCFGGTSYNVNRPGAGRSTVSIPLVCPSSGLVSLTSADNVGYTAIRQKASPLAFQNDQLNVTGLPTTVGGTNVMATFSTTSQDYLSFTITSTEPRISLRIQVYTSKSPCAIAYTITTNNNYPYYYVTTASQPTNTDYYVLIKDRTISGGVSSTSYNITISYVTGNTNCRNISGELTDPSVGGCSGHLSVSSLYNIPVGNVQYSEASAQTVYDTLIMSWPESTCNSSLRDYACKSVFQPALCNSDGSKTTTFYCQSDCESELKNGCSISNENLCQSTSCSIAANTINACKNPPKPPPSPGAQGGSGAQTIPYLMLLTLVSLLSMSLFQ